MKLNTLSMFMLTSLMMVGCAQNPLDRQDAQNPEQMLTSVEASIEIINPVKSHLDGLKVLWSTADKLKLFAGQEGAEFAYKSLTSDGKGIFEGVLAQADRYVALYPYTLSASIDAAGVITTSLQDIQDAVPGTFADNTNLSAAISDTPSFGMKNVCAVVKLDVAREDILSIVLKGNADENLAGDVKLTMNQAGVPSCTVINGKKAVTLKGTQALKKGTYYMAVLPQNLAKGMTLTYNFADKTAKTVKSNLAVALTRSVILNIGNPISGDIAVDKKSISADVEGGNYEINVTASGAWKAVSDQPWCKISGGSATGNGKFTITIERSTDYKYRTAEVAVTSGAAKQLISIQHVGTKIGNIVWANANVNQPDTFCDNREGRGLLYVWNTKKGYETGSANTWGTHGNTPYEGFETGFKDAGTTTWLKENDPCPEGWRVASIKDWDELILQKTDIKHFYFDYDMTCGMSVAGAFVGKDLDTAKKYTKGQELGECIFVPQAGQIYCEDGVQWDWYSASCWARETVAPTNTWDCTGVYFAANQDFNGRLWLSNMCALSVRCVLDQQ